MTLPNQSQGDWHKFQDLEVQNLPQISASKQCEQNTDVRAKLSKAFRIDCFKKIMQNTNDLVTSTNNPAIVRVSIT